MKRIAFIIVSSISASLCNIGTAAATETSASKALKGQVSSGVVGHPMDHYNDAAEKRAEELEKDIEKLGNKRKSHWNSSMDTICKSKTKSAFCKDR